MLPITSILHATDFSEHSHSAYQIARSLARDYGAKLYLVHAVPYPVVPVADGIPMAVPLYDDSQAKEDLHKLAQETEGVYIETHAEMGDPAEIILEYAKKHDVDLIVLGTHGRSGLSRLLMGSTAEEVQRGASCPVLTVRTPFPVRKPESTKLETTVLA